MNPLMPSLTPSPQQTLPSSVNILIVEDDLSLQEGIRDLLEIGDVGYETVVHIADNGHAGLQKLEKITPDLIISDIMMPQMDGYTFLNAVRADERWVHIPFIFLTAKGNKKDIRQGRLSGAELYITKPFNSEELMDLVESQLRRSLQLQAVRNQNMSKLKRSILQLINHEFRTPLTYVTAYYDMLYESLSVYDDVQHMEDYLKGIQSGCDRLIDLVEDLILVMDVRLGEMRRFYDKKAVEISSIQLLIKDAVSKLEAEAQKFNIPIELQLASLSPVIGVAEQIETAVYHLVENAIKFSVYKIRNGEEASVTITAEEVDSHIYIHIKDEGIGIPTSQQEAIFEVFYQYNRDYYEQQGSGAGLVIAKGIAEAHNGQILLQSEEGKGSDFTLVLPTARKVRGSQKARPGNTQHRRNAHVLLVEDDTTLLDSLHDLLRIYWGPYKLHIETAPDGLQALKKVKKRKPDLIISDIMMPNMNGYELIQEIRKNEAWIHIPFIFLSAKTEHKEVHRGLSLGAEEYIRKPYDSDQLVSLITSQLDRYFQRQASSQQSFEHFKQDILNLLRPEFRVPLTSVNKYSQSLSDSMEGVNTSAELKDSLRAIQQGSQQISTLVEDFIALAELRTGETANAFKNRAYPLYDINFILEDAYRKHRLAKTDQLKLVLHMAKQTKPIRIDQTPFIHAFNRIFGLLLQTGLQNRGHNLYCYGRDTEDGYQLKLWQDGGNISAELAKKFEIILESDDSDEILNLSEYAPALKIASWLIDIHQSSLIFKYGLRDDGRFMPDTFYVTLPYYDMS